MSELRDLLIGIAVLVPSLASAFVLIWNAVRGGSSRGEAKRAATRAARETAECVIDALADGDITPDELDEIQRTQRGGDDS